MKGGSYLSLEAIRQLELASIRTRLPITVLYTSDEEVGSAGAHTLDGHIVDSLARRGQLLAGLLATLA